MADTHDVLDPRDPQRDAELKKIRETFIDWLVTPRTARRPATQAAFANHWGVHAGTLSKWKRTKYVEREVFRRNVDYVAEDIQEILDALISEAKKGSYQHIRLALEMAGYLDPSRIERIRLEEELAEIRNQAGGDVLEMSDDELMGEFEKLRETIDARREAGED